MEYINELYRKKEMLRSTIIDRDNLGADATNTARALASMDGVSNRAREDIRAIDDEIEFLQTIVSEVINLNVGDVINQMGGCHLLREQTGIATIRLIIVVGKYSIPAEYPMMRYRDDKHALSKQIGNAIGRTLYQLIGAVQ